MEDKLADDLQRLATEAVLKARAGHIEGLIGAYLLTYPDADPASLTLVEERHASGRTVWYVQHKAGGRWPRA